VCCWTTPPCSPQRELLAGKPDLFVVSIDPAILAVRQVAGALPVVMMNVSDPIALGLVSSLAHPGGNITGMTRLSSELIVKNLELLVEVVPNAKRIAMIVNAGAAASLMVSNARLAAQSRRLSLQVFEVRAAADLDGTFSALAAAGADGLLVSGDVIFFATREQLARLALAQRLPAIFAYTESVEAGGLLAYSPSSTDNYRRAGGFVRKILQGAAPGDIPIEQPTKFELALNLITARALGIVFPQSLLLRADRVIG
jgi:putative ABC transport system substrate-binding protein